LGKSPICWIFKKQSWVATSIVEADYINTSKNVKKILWLRNIIKEILNKKLNITIYTDNQSSKCIMKNDEINSKLKHKDIRYHFNRDNILNKRINLRYVGMERMSATYSQKIQMVQRY